MENYSKNCHFFATRDFLDYGIFLATQQQLGYAHCSILGVED